MDDRSHGLIGLKGNALRQGCVVKSSNANDSRMTEPSFLWLRSLYRGSGSPLQPRKIIGIEPIELSYQNDNGCHEGRTSRH